MKSNANVENLGRSIGLVAVGSLAGQGVATLGVLLLARLYGPVAFGNFALMVAVAAVVSVVAAGRFESAIPLPGSRSEATTIAQVCLWAACSVCILGGGLWGVLDLIGAHVAVGTVLAGVCTGGAMCAVQTLNQMAVRDKRYRLIAQRNALLPIVTVIVQALLALTDWRSRGLEIGYLLAYLLTAGWLLRGLERALLSRPRGARRMMRQYRSFPLHLAPAGALNSLGQQLPVVIVSGAFGAAVAGWFGMTQRAVAMPLSVVGAATAQVFLSHAAEASREDPARLRGLFEMVSRRLIMVAVVVAVGVPIVAPWLFPLLLGERWREAGVFAALLAPGLACQLVGAPLSQTLIVLGRTRAQLAWDSARVAALFLVGAACWSAWLSPRLAVAALSACMVISYVCLWLMNWRAVTRHRQTAA